MPVLHMCRYAPGVHVISFSSQFEIELVQKLSTPFPITLPLLRYVGHLQTGCYVCCGM